MSLLRPHFTQALLETLKKESVNVHGPYGQGQNRLLDDLKPTGSGTGDYRVIGRYEMLGGAL